MKKTILIYCKSIVLTILACVQFVAYSQNDCNDPDNIKHVKVNIHYLLKDDGSGNFHETGDGWGNPYYTGFDYAEDMIDSINVELDVNPGIPGGMQVLPYDYTITDFGFRFVLAGVYFHRNTSLYDTYDLGYDLDNAGSSLWNMSGTSQAGYLRNENEEINIFILSSPSFGNTGVFQGVAGLGGKYCHVFNSWLTYKYGHQNWGPGTPPSELHRFEARTIAHELGHNLNLGHAYLWDGIDDTKQLGYSCWTHTATGNCSDWNNITNNLLDYNGYDDYSLTPMQITKVRTHLNTTKSQYVQQCSNCDVAHANLYVPENQCLPVYIDGTASQNEDKHFLEIVEVDPNNNNALVSGTYFSSWFNGAINRIDDLGAYAGYNFIHGKRYRIKLAVQNYDPNGGFCTQWDETELYYIDINDGLTCCSSGLQIHTFYDVEQKCIEHFQASSSCPNNSISQVVFQIGSYSFTDTEPTFIVNMPSSGPFAGTVYATFHFNDGTSKTISVPYERCVTNTTDPDPGGYEKTAATTPIEEITVYPNPSAGVFTIENAFDTDITAVVYSTDNKRVAFLRLKALQAKEFDLTHLAEGVYVIQFVAGNQTIKKRLLITK